MKKEICTHFACMVSTLDRSNPYLLTILIRSRDTLRPLLIEPMGTAKPMGK